MMPSSHSGLVGTGVAAAGFVDNSDGISKAVIKNMFERAEKILVVGNFWKSYISSFVPQRADRIIIIPNSTAPIHLQINPSPEGTVRIVFLGLIGDRKGIPQLLEALAANADLEDWSAVLAGNGEVEETGLGAGVLNDPVESVVWLARRMAQYGQSIEPGHVILSGSFIRPVECPQGSEITADFGDFGRVDISFA